MAGCFPESYQWVWPFNHCHETSIFNVAAQLLFHDAAEQPGKGQEHWEFIWLLMKVKVQVKWRQKQLIQLFLSKKNNNKKKQKVKYISSMHKSWECNPNRKYFYFHLCDKKKKILLVWSCLLCDLVHDVWGGNDLHCIPSVHFLSFNCQCKKQKTIHISLNTLQCIKSDVNVFWHWIMQRWHKHVQ